MKLIILAIIIFIIIFLYSKLFFRSTFSKKLKSKKIDQWMLSSIIDRKRMDDNDRYKMMQKKKSLLKDIRREYLNHINSKKNK